MTQVFLSCTGEDQSVAGRLVSQLERMDIQVYWWQQPERRGGRFPEEITSHIDSADSFLALMSPAYLRSDWCQRESDLAVLRETDSGRRFIWVAKVAETDKTRSRFLRSYDWLDLVPVTDDKLQDVARTLAGTATGPGPHPLFRNRHDELNAIRNALSVAGGQDLWLVVSPPRLGKSWLLDQLRFHLSGEGWAVRRLDLRMQPHGLRTDPVGLLRALLDLDDNTLASSADLADPDVQFAVAAAIARRSQHQLYLLDTADLLDRSCAARLRAVLTGIYDLVKRSGYRQTRLGVVIGSRRDDDWKGLGRGTGAAARFRSISLTEFGTDVVHQALADVGQGLGAEQLDDWARRLVRLSEGLPALLVRGLVWAEQQAFLGASRADQQSTFEQVAGPYITGDLLSVDSLLPFGGSDLGQAQALLERTLRVLVVYRLFTRSHLRFHIQADPGFQAALDAAKWTLDDLWGRVGQTALLKRPLDELWQVIHPPIRRLLYRHYYATDDERCGAHASARQFYERWTVRNAGKEQSVVLLECLWHEAMQMIIRDRAGVSDALPGLAASLASEFASSPFYDAVELGAYVTDRLRDDEEFQLALRDYDGLFENVVESVSAAISGSP